MGGVDQWRLVAAAFAGATSPLVFTYLDQRALPLVLVIFLSALAAAATYWVVEKLLVQAPKTNAWSRRLLDPRAHFEGKWIYTTDKPAGRFYAIANIAYDSQGDDYYMEGLALTPSGDLHATWTSTRLHFDSHHRTLKYGYEATIMSESAANDAGARLEGYGSMQLNGNHELKAGFGIGNFVDGGQEPLNCHFAFQIVDRDLLVQLIKKPATQSLDDIKELVRQFHAVHGKRTGLIDVQSQPLVTLEPWVPRPSP